jgi:hypothetical protein
MSMMGPRCSRLTWPVIEEVMSIFLRAEEEWRVGCLTDEVNRLSPRRQYYRALEKIDTDTGLRKACDSWTQGVVALKKILTYFGNSGIVRAGLS